MLSSGHCGGAEAVAQALRHAPDRARAGAHTVQAKAGQAYSVAHVQGANLFHAPDFLPIHLTRHLSHNGGCALCSVLIALRLGSFGCWIAGRCANRE